MRQRPFRVSAVQRAPVRRRLVRPRWLVAVWPLGGLLLVLVLLSVA